MTGPLVLWLLSTPVADAASRCAAYGPAATVAAPPGLAVSESSGLAVSRTRSGVVYTHDDSGGAAMVYALRETGEVLGGHPLPRGWNNDWEALSAGPCPHRLGVATTGSCLYIGDLGDNRGQRPRVVVRVVVEPAEGDPVGTPLSLLETWRLTYPDGPQDAEAMLVHPQTGSVDVLTKRLDGSSRLFRVPTGAPDGTDRTLQPLGALPVTSWASDPWVTDAAWSPEGDLVVVRTYTTFALWSVDPCAPDGWWQRPPDQVVPAPTARQGEAVALAGDGGLVSTSEGHPMPLFVQPCLQPTAPRSCAPLPAVEAPGAAPPDPRSVPPRPGLQPGPEEAPGSPAETPAGCATAGWGGEQYPRTGVLGLLLSTGVGYARRRRDPRCKTR